MLVSEVTAYMRLMRDDAGVIWSKQHKKWQAAVYVPGRRGTKKYLGFFETAEEAAHAYDRYDTGDIQAEQPDHAVGRALDCRLGL